MSVDIKSLPVMDKPTFLNLFGSIYEHSEWVADQLWREKEALLSNIDNAAARIHQAMAAIVDSSTDEQKLVLLRAHPDLAGKAALAGELTIESTSEQAGAGLDKCSVSELAEFQSLNDQYKTKFEFPFIMAVKGANKVAILQGFKTRIHHSREEEFITAINEVHKIARFRLDALFE